ncbi:hypothetical protein DSM106972_049480 [Dulcicalothrix desertica PCC 7102]|uniref:Uncharacterized protein n=1 Tax=Dulcicalothrix desertica PCC 7102 TaxID=232991 RepID=A0A433VD64_9CYAN|nr:aminoglycoside phosphotransferase [Dulcicalothrix desertica]RUT04034.1 hypothetical protein DSM106972_049480 [Dulcicalothrix desertica PCC 7102]TWH43562.1 hypothetical protein CAL7102_07296 [Dulcicalothrix desertica PCC 7102]
MQTIQDCLTITIVVLFATITTTIALDLCVSLTQLWNNVANQEVSVQKVYLQTSNIANMQPQLTATEMKTVCISATDLSAPTAPNSTNIKSLELLIQKLPQSRVRTAARRLEIKDKVDGSYQKLGVLRAQLQ